jgi:hypothetical protein
MEYLKFESKFAARIRNELGWRAFQFWSQVCAWYISLAAWMKNSYTRQLKVRYKCKTRKNCDWISNCSESVFDLRRDITLARLKKPRAFHGWRLQHWFSNLLKSEASWLHNFWGNAKVSVQLQWKRVNQERWLVGQKICRVKRRMNCWRCVEGQILWTEIKGMLIVVLIILWIITTRESSRNSGWIIVQLPR